MAVDRDLDTASIPDAILDLSDRLLAEVSRRRHCFGWLREPQAAWLPVDAYYPRHRLVLLATAAPAGDDAGELAAARGLRLIRLDCTQLPADAPGLERALRDLLGEALAAPPPRVLPPADPPRQAATGPARGSAFDGAWSRVATSLSLATATTKPPPQRRVVPRRVEAAQRAARHFATARAPGTTRLPTSIRTPTGAPIRAPQAAPRAGPRRGVARTRGTPVMLDALTAQLVLVLALAVVAELYFGVARLAALGGHWLLAFGLSLDVVARILGTVAAHRSGAQLAGWSCALLGSPAVAGFALFSGEEPVAIEPAPLAGIVSLMAMAAIALALVGRALGI